MPVNFSGLFDSVLVIAGLVFIITGLAMLVRSKSSGDGWSVDACGLGPLRAVW